MSPAMLVRRLDERREQWMGLQSLRLELGMELASEKERMLGNLDNFNVGSIGRSARNAQASRRQRAFILAIKLIAMAMALADLGLSVGPVSERTALEAAGPGAESHGSAQLFDPAQFAQFVNDAMRRRWIELAGVRLLQSTDIARKLNARGLHSKADTEIRNLVFARILNALQHAFDAALTESAGN